MNSLNRSKIKNAGLASTIIACSLSSCTHKEKEVKPNVVFVFADQWRVQSTGYAGNKQVITPNIDKLAEENLNFTTAISSCPVSSPYRASMLTGQYPLTHGIFYNDKPLRNEVVSIAEVYKEQGYQTAYIGKWHINGHPKGENTWKHRLLPIPKERRQGFDYWKVLECTHDYNNSIYYDENNIKHTWKGYDAKVQTDSAIAYIKKNKEKPFVLYLSWGPPHAPYQTAPEKYREKYADWESIELRPNVPDSLAEKAKQELAGYYAHINALDDYIGEIQKAIKEAGIEENTIFVFTADHGDMLQSHSLTKKQKPWDESIRVPFILKYPAKFTKAKEIRTPFVTPDIMPTLLGLSNINIPKTVEGTDFSSHLLGTENLDIKAGLIMLPVPFHQWSKENGGREFRGVRTERYTYVKDLNGPWLLYDNQKDPYQLNNLVNKEETKEIQAELEEELQKLLTKTNDEFREDKFYMEKWNYDWD